METEQTLLLRFLESNENLLSQTASRLKNIEDGMASIKEKVIHLEALALKEKLEKTEEKIGALERTVSQLKVYGTIVAGALSALVAGAVSLVFK